MVKKKDAQMLARMMNLTWIPTMTIV